MKKCDCNPPKALEIKCPGEVVLFRKVEIPAGMGDDVTYPPRPGMYRNVLLVYKANNHVYMYSSDGIPTFISDGGEGTKDYEDLINKPSIDGYELSGDVTLEDIGVIDAIDDALEEYTPTDELADVALSGDYDDLINKPTIPTVNDATLTITRNNASAGTFTANSATDTTIDIAVPTATSDLTNDSGFITNTVNNLTNYYTKTETDSAIGVETTNRENADQGLQGQIDALASASDVVDVVGTYAELQAYDTSHLNDNDIIKVLTDETHNDAISYYRWDTDTDTFSYIGSQGPFYTKAESDATFVPQTRTVNNKALSSNITLTAADVHALPDSTVIPTVNNATLTIKKNGTNVATFTANSATDTAADISVPTATSDLTNDSGFLSADTNCASGPSLQTTGVEGSPLTLTELAGNATQAGTPTPDAPVAVNTTTGENVVKITGKNLAKSDDPDNPDANYISSGTGSQPVQFDTTHNAFTSTTSRGRNFNNLVSGQTYTFSMYAQVNPDWAQNIVVYFYRLDSQTGSVGTVLGSITKNLIPSGGGRVSKSITIPEGWDGLRVNFYGASYWNDIQLELGSTATPYEPYQGQEYEVNLGKNLSSISQYLGIVWGANKVDYKNLLNTLSAGTYTFSAVFTITERQDTTDDSKYGIYFANSAGLNVLERPQWGAVGVGATATLTKTFTITEAQVGKFTNAYFYGCGGATGNANSGRADITNIQLEKGSATTYAPYFTPIELAKIGTYQDRIYKNDGKWYVEKQVGKVVFGGTQSLSYQNNDFVYSGFQADNLPLPKQETVYGADANILVISDHYTGQQSDYRDQCFDAHIMKVTGANNQIAWKDTRYTTTTDMTTWLTSHPTTVYYALATPTTTEITEQALIEQLNFVANLYEGTNNIMLVGTGAQGEITVCHSDVSRVAITGSYNDLTDKPTIPTVNDATLTIQKEGSSIGTFTANSATNTTINVVETDPTVPSWAKQPTKPTYSYSEITNKPTIPSKTSDLVNDGADNTSVYVEADELATVATTGSYNDLTDKPADFELVEMSYGESNAWAKFIAAYQGHKIVYCRASSNSNPATGTQGRKAFMAYVNNADNPTEVEFQYVRSVSSKTASQPVDQVFVYKLTNASGGTWTVQTRDMGPKLAQGTNTTVSYSNGTYTISATQPTVPTKTSDLTNDGSDGTSTYVEADDLATVATSGSYNDLSNKPTIPAAQVNSDWNASSGVAQILNKPTLATVATSGSYNDLSNKPTIPTVNNATLTIQKNGTNVQTFTANQATNATANITVPTATSDLTNDSGFLTNTDYATASTGGVVKVGAGLSITGGVLSATGGGVADAVEWTNVLNRPSTVSYWTNDAGYITNADLPTKTSDLTNDGSDGTAQYLETDETAYRTTSIPYGQCDSTSTSTVFTATVPGITELRDGVCMWLKNGVVTSASGFTININNLGAKPVYNNMAAATRDTTLWNVNYTMFFVYDSTRVEGGCWILYRGYNSDNNTIGYQLRTNSTALTTTDRTRYYRILFTSADNTHWVPANTQYDNSATSNKTINQRKINPFGRIVYLGNSTSYPADAAVTATAIWDQYAFNLGYSFSKGSALTMTYPKPVYVKCAPQTDGSAIIDSTTPYVQDLPSTDDGKIYIYLGMAYSATNVEMVINHPIYYYKDGAIREWTNATAGITSVAWGDITGTLSDQTDLNAALGAKANSADLATVATSGSYNDLSNKPTIPTVNNATLTIQKNSTNVATFTANASSNVTANISVPTATSDLTNDSGFITSITKITNAEIDAIMGVA